MDTASWSYCSHLLIMEHWRPLCFNSTCDHICLLQPMEIYVDDEAKLTLHGLVQVSLTCESDWWFLVLLVKCFLLAHPFALLLQHYIKLSEPEKNRKLTDLLDALDFNQVVIFVKSVSRAAELNKLLADCNFPSICIHSGMPQEERYAFHPFWMT